MPGVKSWNSPGFPSKKRYPGLRSLKYEGESHTKVGLKCVKSWAEVPVFCSHFEILGGRRAFLGLSDSRGHFSRFKAGTRVFGGV